MAAAVVEQFTQTDPTPLGAGTAFESPYVYGLNNPLVYTDPSGLRGGLPGCPWLNRGPIANSVPERLALSSVGSQVWPLPPFPVPGTIPGRVFPGGRVTPTTRPGRVVIRGRGPTRTPASSSTTVVGGEETSTTVVETTTTRKGQTCSNERLEFLTALKDAACKGPFSCSDKAEKRNGKPFTCPQLAANVSAAQGCIAARVRFQDECFAGSPEPGHEIEIQELNNAVNTCRQKALARGCK